MSTRSFKRVGVLGSGQVGQTLASGLLGLGCEVMIGSREPGKLDDWVASSGGRGRAGTFEQTAVFGEVVVLACLGRAAEELVRSTRDALGGKTVIDATNPIAAQPPQDGVLRYFTGPDESLMERLQAIAPTARFVKAFSCVGSPFMVNPEFPGGPPTMFICGDDGAARGQVREILDAFGWETEDIGGAAAARAIEPLAMLWCIPGLRGDRWTHAFKLLRR